MVERRQHGALKAEVLDLLRTAGEPLSARALIERWPAADATPALTTVLTVLDRLRRAGLLQRTEAGGEYRFQPVSAPAPEAAASMVQALLSTSDRSGALLTFAGGLDDDDLRLLRRAIGDA